VNDYHETFWINLKPRALKRVHAAIVKEIAAAGDEFEDDDVIAELVDVELEMGNRLARIEKGDLQA
jgi:hypothetical protein